MGARGSSPRTVQIENDSPVSVIDVSDAVVDRLKGLHSKGLCVFIFNNNLKIDLWFREQCLCNRFDIAQAMTLIRRWFYFHNFMWIFLILIALDVAQQKEHDRRVAEAAVAAARLEWEKQLQQQSPKQSITQAIPAPIQTIIHSGTGTYWNKFVIKMMKSNKIDWYIFRWFHNFSVGCSPSKRRRVA